MSEFSWLIAFVGRPNAGKSSLIRRLTAADPVVGKKPGSTRKINEYSLTHNFKVVDVPGWGKIHSRTKEYEERMKEEIVDFFEENSFRIPACILVIDSKSLVEVSQRLAKKGIIPIDYELYDFLKSFKIEPIVVFNKIDKIDDGSLQEALDYFKKLIEYESLSLDLQEDIITASAKDGTNLDKLRDAIRRHLRKNDVEEFERYIKVRK